MKRYLLLTIFAVLALFPSKAQYSLSYKLPQFGIRNSA